MDSQLCVVVEGERLRALFEVQVPAQASLVSKLWRSGGPSGLDLVDDFLGKARVAQFTGWPSHGWTFDDLAFGSPRLISDGPGTARIQTESDPYFFGTTKASLGVNVPYENVASWPRTITVDARDMEVYPGRTNATLSQTLTYGRAPKGKATDPGCGISLGTGMTRYVYRLNHVPDSRRGDGPPPTSIALNRDHGASWWPSDVAGDTVPAVDVVLWIGAGAFAYMLAAWYLRRTRLRRSELRTSLFCVFWLLVAAGALWTARDLLSHDVFRGVATTFSNATARRSPTLEPSVVVIDSLVPIAALAWPLMTWAVNRFDPAPPTPPGRSWQERVLAVVPALAAAADAAVITAVAAAVAAEALSRWSDERWALPWTVPVAAALGAVIGLSLTVFLVAASSRLASRWALVFGVAMVGVTATGPFAFTTLDRGWRNLPSLTYFVAMLSLTAGGLILLLRIRAPQLPRRRFIVVSVAAYVLAIGALILPHAVDLLLHPKSTVGGPWNLPPLAQDLEALLYVVVLISFLVMLARIGTIRGVIKTAALHRTLGVLFVILNFYWFDDRWLYLPVPVLLGWLLAARWLFPINNVELAKKVREDRAATRLSQKDEGKILLELSRAERRYRALVTAGTGPELKKAKKHLKAARKAAAGQEPALRDRFFGVPGLASPWQLGKLGAIAGTSLGALWMLLYLDSLARHGFGYGLVGGEHYPALWMFGQVFGVLTQWSLLGLALGYFFPYIRGSNAVSKALSLFVTFAMPSVVLSLLWWRRDMLETNLWLALQALVFTAALGMIMDYLMARRTGIEVSAYVEVRGLGTVLGWGGAVVGATITATFALAQSTVSLVIQNLLHLTSPGGPGQR